MNAHQMNASINGYNPSFVVFANEYASITTLKDYNNPIKAMSHSHCTKCKDPAGYSFKKVSDKNGVCIFYSNPAKAKIFKEYEGLIEHFEHMMAQNASKKWKWIFDGEGFDTDHMFEMNIGMAILDLLTTKYGNQLHEVIVINPSIHVKIILKTVFRFLDDRFQAKVHVKDDRTYSILEFM
jgi:hypothetical protein